MKCHSDSFLAIVLPYRAYSKVMFRYIYTDTCQADVAHESCEQQERVRRFWITRVLLYMCVSLECAHAR